MQHEKIINVSGYTVIGYTMKVVVNLEHVCNQYLEWYSRCYKLEDGKWTLISKVGYKDEILAAKLELWEKLKPTP